MNEYIIFKWKTCYTVNLNLLEWVFLCFYTNINKFAENKVKGEFGNYIAFYLYRRLLLFTLRKAA